MKINEIKALDAKQLAEKLEEKRAQLRQLKLNHVVTPLANPSEIKSVRRDIARLETVIRQNELNK